MRIINVNEIEEAVAGLCLKSNIYLSDDVKKALAHAVETETSPTGQNILHQIEENVRIAGEKKIPMCQDTGLACVFMEVGQEVFFEGGYVVDAVNRGVARGYTEDYLRKSVVADPLRRTNTGDNTPAHLVYEVVPGDKVKITMAPKGFGSENTSRIKMLVPADGEQGVMDFVVDTVRQAGGKPCPPIVVGVGIGGTFDKAATMAKKALLKPLDEPNEDPYYAEMEKELLKRINALDIGPQGMGGVNTALGVSIIQAPTHIAGLPVAVNINCHVCRHETVIL